MFNMKAFLLIVFLLIVALNAEKLEPQIKLVQMEVNIKNDLEHHQDMLVHCKDANADFGLHKVPYGQSYKLEFQQRGGRDDYYCGFVFDKKLHWFDVYVAERDYRYCGVYAYCAWSIKENGPCEVDDPDDPDDCHPWNQNGHRPLA